MATSCTDVLNWLRQPDSTAQITLPPADMVTHVAGCPVCRGALSALVIDLLQVNPESLDMTCTGCQEDLAAFIDIERDQGSAAAVATYPSVWWHLWVCADCAETYHLTNALMDAEATGELGASPLTVYHHMIRAPVYLSRSFLHQVLEARSMLGVAWGGDADTLVLVDEECDGYRLCLSMQPSSSEAWTMYVIVEPPAASAVRIRIGSEEFRAAFSPAGEALLTPIPAHLLREAAGPDLVITLE